MPLSAGETNAGHVARSGTALGGTLPVNAELSNQRVGAALPGSDRHQLVVAGLTWAT